MTRLDQNRGMSQVAAKVGVPVTAVEKVVIWGNHSSTQFPDVYHAEVTVGGQKKAARDAINDDAWVKDVFISVSMSWLFFPELNGEKPTITFSLFSRMKSDFHLEIFTECVWFIESHVYDVV
jgi:hypothetical protein